MEFKTFPQGLWRKIQAVIFPQKCYPHSTEAVDKFWNKVILSESVCSFLAPARKEPKEAGQRGAELIAPAIKDAPFGNPRRALDDCPAP